MKKQYIEQKSNLHYQLETEIELEKFIHQDKNDIIQNNIIKNILQKHYFSYV
ncbi:hypothetical protein pb186bvf_021131 [Paramecium bursaria]